MVVVICETGGIVSYLRHHTSKGDSNKWSFSLATGDIALVLIPSAAMGMG